MPDIPDRIALLYLASAFFALSVLTFHLGLYADDYWNLLAAKKHTGFEYFSNHMTRINSRYTYALVNRLMFLLFFDTGDVFAWLYIRTARIFVLSCHFVGIWFIYKSLVLLRLPKHVLLCLLPFVALPVYGHQALFWLGAAYAYPVGLALFGSAMYCLLTQRHILFAVLTFFALGATEFVILPSLAAAGLYWLFGILHRDDGERLSKKQQAVRLIILLSPFIAWGLLVTLTPAASSRLDKIHRYPKLIHEPAKWFVTYFKYYLRSLQPALWMQEHWYVFPAFFALMVAFVKGFKDRLFLLFFISLYFISILPLSAVGYDFRPIRTGRVWYMPGIFFYIALISSVVLLLKRVPSIDKKPWLQKARAGAIALFVVGFSVVFLLRIKEITTDGENAYGCIRGIIETVEQESNGKAPSRVEVCGFPPSLYYFSIFRSPYTGPYALGLVFDLKETIPFSSKQICSRGWGKAWSDGRCPYEARYKIATRQKKKKK